MSKKQRRSDAVPAGPALEKIMGGPLTFGRMLGAIRQGEELTLEAFAKQIDVSRAHLCDVEQGRKVVSVERAAKWAKVLGHSEPLFVKLALQAALDRAGIKLEVDVRMPRRS